MRSRRVFTVFLALCPDGARNDRGVGVASFPPPELPGFTGTTTRSDFSCAVCLSRLFASSGIPVPAENGRGRSAGDLKGCRFIRLYSAIGSPTPGAYGRLAMLSSTVLPSAQTTASAQSIRYTFSGLNPIHGRAASPSHSTSLPFCLRFNVDVADDAARLDTSCPAQASLGGTRPRWMTRPCLFAPSVGCCLPRTRGFARS